MSERQIDVTLNLRGPEGSSLGSQTHYRANDEETHVASLAGSVGRLYSALVDDDRNSLGLITLRTGWPELDSLAPPRLRDCDRRAR